MRNIVCIAALAAALGAGAASAQTVQAQADARVEPVRTDAQAGVQADPAAAQAARNDPRCLTQTGSRIQASSRGKPACAGYGRSYDRKDLERTGETDVGQALRKLDPRLR
jgi:opacity protein-like surface antigen